MARPQVTQVGDHTVLATGTDVSWLVVRDGSDVTLVDGGYPRDVDLVEASLALLGHRPQDVRAILLTHAHVDHLGGAAAFSRRHGTPILCHRDEVAHAHRERLEQAGPLDVARNLHRRGVLAWTARVVRAGALRDVAVPWVEAVDSHAELDLPGRPVLVPTPGHTSGHAAYLLPGDGVVATGDALVTGHPTSPHRGPQLLPAWFAHAQTGRPRDGLLPLADLDADVVAPGHGPSLTMPVAAAVALALERADD